MSSVSSPIVSTVSTPLTSAPSSPILKPVKETPSFLDSVTSRRSIYALNKDLLITRTRLQTIINTLTTTMPTSFNSQSTRQIVLTGASHTHFWDLVTDALRAHLPAERFAPTAARLAGFSAAAGTVLFFVDAAPVRALQEKMPAYAANFPTWAIEASGMHQFALWTALEAEGLGANLQHYGNLVEEEVRKEWDVPEDWSLKAQLVFGGKAGEAGEKTSRPVEEMVAWHD